MCLFILRAVGASPAQETFEFTRLLDGHCDCDTVLDRKGSGRDERRIAKLRREGWSDAKIRRSEETRAAAPRAARRSDQMTQWMERIPRMVAEDGWLGLVLHWGDESAPAIRSRTVIAVDDLDDLDAEALSRLKREELYVFVKSPPGT